MTNGARIDLTRQFDCPVEVVFDAIGKGLLLKSTGIHDESFIHEFSEGKKYSFQWKSGGRCSGTYQQIVPKELVTFTWKSEGCKHPPTSETLVTVTLSAQGRGCELKLVHEGLDAGLCFDDHLAGWTGSLDEFVADLNKVASVR